MTKAVFLDRDGTINVDCEYLHEKEKFRLLPGVVTAMKMLREAGFLLIVVTNQSGIGRGYFSEEEYSAFEEWMKAELRKQEIEPDAFYHCPHIDKDNCECRKPKTGMFKMAAKDFDIDWARSYAIGDKIRDLSICNETETRGILVENARTYEDGTKPNDVFVPKVNSLLEAAQIIISAAR